MDRMDRPWGRRLTGRGGVCLLAVWKKVRRHGRGGTTSMGKKQRRWGRRRAAVEGGGPPAGREEGRRLAGREGVGGGGEGGPVPWARRHAAVRSREGGSGGEM